MNYHTDYKAEFF